MNTHEASCRIVAKYIRDGRILSPRAAEMLEAAADYLKAHEDLANECRRKVEVQIVLRVEAQARAGRLAREARR